MTDRLPSRAGGTEELSQALSRELEPVLIEAVSGPAKGARAVLASGTLTLGSGDGCGLLLEDPAVSRLHAMIELRPGLVVVRDHGSRNGVFYQGARIAEAEVPVGGSIALGRTVLQVRAVARQEPLSSSERLHELIGRSLSMRRLFAQVERLAPLETRVLIQGETGAGKDAVARALHALSPRAERPLVVFDCAATNEALVESELFGHVRGAFTGADRLRVGALQAAEGGTLYFDNLSELGPALQPKLLRALESGTFSRLGDSAVQRFSARVLASSRRNLEAEVEAGRFRRDLFHRVAVAVVEVPPLRERPEDIPLLAQRFAEACSGFEVKLSPMTLAAFQCDPWPGNVRELRNAVERALALGEPAGAPEPQASGGRSFLEARERLLESFERDYLLSLLARHPGNASAAIRESKLSRTQFYRLLRRHQISRPRE